MESKRNTKLIMPLIIAISLLFSCEDDCTKMVNIPRYDQILMTFVDNFQEVPCDFDEPVDEPVN